MKKSSLAGLSHTEFLRRHWQKKPLLARNALREYAGAVTRERLFELASRDDVESRIVTRTRGRWQVRHGPFGRGEIRRLPRTGWTLLVQGVDLVDRHAARLLREFDFIPHARLDDVMVSYAAPGGGVGAHFDSYDVFLVQGEGERRWRVSAQRNLELVPGAPLRILRDFEPDREWTLAPGDVLYLPPRWAHEGVAAGNCVTYSVGFRAPGAQELGSRFLDFLQDRLALEGVYSDPDLQATRHPGRLPHSLLERSAGMLEPLRWSHSDISDFMGRYLTEPKANVVFQRPRGALSRGDFRRRARARGVQLALTSRMLYRSRRVFINGEALSPGAAASHALRNLADERELRPPLELAPEAQQLLYEWYLAGYISLDTHSCE